MRTLLSHNADGGRPVERVASYSDKDLLRLDVTIPWQLEHARKPSAVLRSRGPVEKYVPLRDNEDELIQVNLARNLVFE